MIKGIDPEKFHRLLIDRRDELERFRDTGNAAAETVSLDQTRIGRLTRMDALQQQAVQQENNRRRDMELKRIASALRRIEQGEYGFCLNCGEAIAVKRLEFDPAAALCIHCANRSEQ